MAMNDSNKMPYLLAAGAIGGAVGYLFLTQSGQRVRQSLFNAETGSTIPDKIDAARSFIESRGRDAGNRLKAVVDRVQDSFDEGRRVYQQGAVDFQHRMEILDRKGAQVVSSVHQAIDDFNRTIHSVEGSVLEPLYQAGAMVKAVDAGARMLFSRETEHRLETPTTADTSIYSGRQRVTG